MSPELAASFDTVHIVQHGIDFDHSGAYDGDRESSIAPGVPLEATFPANCGPATGGNGHDGGMNDGNGNGGMNGDDGATNGGGVIIGRNAKFIGKGDRVFDVRPDGDLTVKKARLRDGRRGRPAGAAVRDAGDTAGSARRVRSLATINASARRLAGKRRCSGAAAERPARTPHLPTRDSRWRNPGGNSNPPHIGPITWREPSPSISETLRGEIGLGS